MLKESATDLVFECRAAFARSTARSVADSISADLLCAAVAEGLLAPSAALEYAIGSGDRVARVVALSPFLEGRHLERAIEVVSSSKNAIAGLPTLAARLAESASPELALELAEARTDAAERVSCLLSLLCVLPEALKRRAVRDVRDAAERLDGGVIFGRAHLLLVLSTHVSGEERDLLIAEARAAAKTARLDDALTRALVGAGQIDLALARVRSEPESYWRANYLAAIIPAVSLSERDTLVAEWWDLASREEHRLPRIPLTLPAWAIELVRTRLLARPLPGRTRLLVELAIRHPDALMADALAAVDANTGLTALIGRVRLAEVFDEASRRTVAERATTWVRSFLTAPNPEECAEAADFWNLLAWDAPLAALRPLLSTEDRCSLLRWQLADAHEVHDEAARARAIARFAALLQDPVRSEVLDLARSVVLPSDVDAEVRDEVLEGINQTSCSTYDPPREPVALHPLADPIEQLTAAAWDMTPGERAETLRKAVALARSARWAWPLFSLIPWANELDDEDALFVWRRMLDQLAGLPRLVFFEGDNGHDFAALAPFVFRLGGAEAVVGVTRAVAELGNKT